MDQADLPKNSRQPEPARGDLRTLPLSTLPHDENDFRPGAYSVLIVSIPFVLCYRQDPGLP